MTDSSSSVRPTRPDERPPARPPVSWADLVRIRAETNAQLEAVRAQVRANLAEGHRALAAYQAERTKTHAEGDAAILAALREGKTVRAICASLKVGPHRVGRLRAHLVHPSGSSSSGPDPSPLARARERARHITPPPE